MMHIIGFMLDVGGAIACACLIGWAVFDVAIWSYYGARRDWKKFKSQL